ncbi:FecCD family ABC transporter permease [Derxia gummosa]|uniref:FecCD family ABC transporter permease n=1 Tax=Derxia gummosa DSM 723 TaxID=1121388 RepID=A0A8B6X2G5_9BURK|nr:iron ABC transporter permease [Derxia gummosa]
MTPPPSARDRRARLLGAGGLLLGLALLLLGASTGSTGIDAVWQALDDEFARRIVLDIRLPRSLGSWLAGALLALAGGIAQGLFRNPLADPYLLGSASGASLGVAGWLMLFGGSPATLQWLARLGLTGAAFAGATAGVLLTLVLAGGVRHRLRLLLAGVIVGMVLGSASSLIALLTPEILQAMQAFMLGSTGFIGWAGCGVMAGGLALCLAVALLLARMLDALALGETTALSLGLPLGAMRAALIGALALATGCAVAQTGLVAFVGLVAPHLVRARIRTTHGPMLLLSAITGGALLLAADLFARWIIRPQELPVGSVTAVIGGGYLLWLMHRGRGLDE